MTENSYIVSARKYRPVTFQSVVGQNSLTTTLKNAIVSQKLAHAYLFCGPRGVGKTTCARIFAKTINCLSPTEENEACNMCESCIAFNEQRSYNIHELDAASNNSVEDIRSLIEQVRIPPQIGTFKVYIIDEVHMLSSAAFNSFLKTLEEPPHYAIFILATTEKHKVLPTIISRCQVYDFNRIEMKDISDHLAYVARQEDVEAEEEALTLIAQKADGGMRDALSIFDQMVSYTQGKITYKSIIDHLNLLDYEYYFNMTEYALTNNVVKMLLLFDDVLSRGFDGHNIISGLATHFRNLLIAKDERSIRLFQMGETLKKRYAHYANSCSTEFLFKAIDIITQCDINYRSTKNKRLLSELCLIKLCQISSESNPFGHSEKLEIKPIERSESKTDTPIKSESETKETNASKATSIPKPKKEIEADSESQTNVSTENNRSSKLRPMTPSISGIIKNTAQQSDESIEKGKKEEMPTQDLSSDSPKETFSEEDLIKKWKEFEQSLSTEKLLKSLMSQNLPKLIRDDFFEVSLHALNKDVLMQNKNIILRFLRDSLHNEHLNFDVRIIEVPNSPERRPYTQTEIFEHMKNENPSIQKISDELNLELT